ncbi:MAG: thiamine-phosphate kinase [Saprospiraceae bacterium]
MEKEIKRTDVNALGEFGLIDHLTKDNVIRRSTTLKSIGDDAAIIANNEEVTVISTDMLVEGIHFDLMYTPLKHLGYKSIVVNLSDICAMNCIPSQVTVSIAISNKYSVEALEELYAGINLACKLYNVDLVGGDTTSSPKGMAMSVTAIGQAKLSNIVHRSGANIGDIICVTGDLGAAYLGLQLLEREKQIYLDTPGVQPDFEELDYIVGRQLKPEARLDAIQFMAKENLIPTSMIDISDGLASELFHICKQSNVGAYIEESKIPLHPQAEEQAIKMGLGPMTCALNGGEDYELLFTIKQEDLEKVKYMPDVYLIGEIVSRADGITLHTTGGKVHPLKAQGWNHFDEE